MLNLINAKLFAVLLGATFVFATTALAQTTTFTYQGRFTDSTLPQPTNGSYEMQFKAFDSVVNGNQFPVTVTLPAVQVTNGIFTVQLDLGSSAFQGGDVFLEIGARPSGSPNPITVLNPRQRVTSAPYAVQSLNATNAANANNSVNLGGVAASLYTQTTDPRLSDDRAPTPGSPNYIQNTNSVQPLSNFNVSGNGTVGAILSGNIVDSSTQYNLGGSRVLSVAGTNSTIVGINAGNANSGLGNSFFGNNAGKTNGSGNGNAFFGFSAGRDNLSANFNAFFGSSAGVLNSTGESNSFFGEAAGSRNTTGSDNSFYGTDAGSNVTTASGNSFFGRSAGQVNTAASNSFFGYSAGSSNTSGTQNSFFGENAGSANVTGGGNSFFGYRAGQNNANVNNAFFGALAGQSNTSGGSNSFFGYNAGHANLSGDSNSFFGRNAGSGNTVGLSNSFFGYNAGLGNVNGNANVLVGNSAGQNMTTGIGNTFVGYQAGQSYTGLAGQGSNTLIGFNAKVECPTIGGCFTPIIHATAIGADAIAQYDHEIVLGTAADDTRTMGDLRVGVGGAGNTLFTDKLYLDDLASGGSFSLCLVGNPGLVGFCSSSLRYKTNIASYAKGFEVIDRLNPITFDWKTDGMHDVGFGAEDVAKVDPLLVTYNKSGSVEGVKYDRINATLVNAVKEQHSQIEQQQQQIASQQTQLMQMQRQIDVLKTLVPTPRRSNGLKAKPRSKARTQGAIK